MQQRAETAEGALERERGLHRRELRRRAKELADMQEDLVQVIYPLLMRAAYLVFLWPLAHRSRFQYKWQLEMET